MHCYGPFPVFASSRRHADVQEQLGTPLQKGIYGENRNISGGYTFHAALESRRGQAKYIKIDKLEEDEAFQEEVRCNRCRWRPLRVSPVWWSYSKRCTSRSSSLSGVEA